jgi:hypothetical protein
LHWRSYSSPRFLVTILFFQSRIKFRISAVVGGRNSFHLKPPKRQEQNGVIYWDLHCLHNLTNELTTTQDRAGHQTLHSYLEAESRSSYCGQDLIAPFNPFAYSNQSCKHSACIFTPNPMPGPVANPQVGAGQATQKTSDIIGNLRPSKVRKFGWDKKKS